MCSWNPLGKPIVRGSVLVVRGCGGMRGTSWVARVLWCRPRGGTIILMAVVCTTSVPVIVGTTVIPRTTWVITLSMEGTPVSLKNLFGWWRTGFTWVVALDLGRSRRLRQGGAGDRRWCGATAGSVWVACTWVVNWSKPSDARLQRFKIKCKS